jgi:hypothetical protein
MAFDKQQVDAVRTACAVPALHAAAAHSLLLTASYIHCTLADAGRLPVVRIGSYGITNETRSWITLGGK